MANTGLTEVTNQIQKYWSPLFTKELRESLLLGSLVNRDYQGEIKKGGDRVRVSQVNAPDGQLLTVGTDADSFSSEALSSSYIDITANKRAVASYEFEDLAALQSQIGNQDSEVRQSLMFAVAKQINNYLYSLVSPSASAPDHIITVADMNAAALAAMRMRGAQAKWSHSSPWYALLDPSYYSDVLDDTTLASSDFGAADAPMIGGQLARQRFGFNILEDNSRSTDYGIFFVPAFMHLVMQQEAQVKISDLHGQKKFGYVISVDVVFGASQGVDGDEKVIKATA